MKARLIAVLLAGCAAARPVPSPPKVTPIAADESPPEVRDELHLAPMFALARANVPNARTATIVSFTPDERRDTELAAQAARRAGFDTNVLALDGASVAKADLQGRIGMFRAAAAGRKGDVVVALNGNGDPRDWIHLPYEELGAGVVIARWVEDGTAARERDWQSIRVFVRPLADRVEHHAIVRGSLGPASVGEAPRLGLAPLERGIERNGAAATVAGSVVRDDDRAAIVVPSAYGDRTTVRLRGTKADALGRGTTHATATGTLCLVAWTEAGREYELEVDALATIDEKGWNDYARALTAATAAFDRNDVTAARRALANARASVAALGPTLEVYRFIDGLTKRFDDAANAIEARRADAVAYAGAVLPLGVARAMTGRPETRPSERDMATAAYRFARRAVMRELKAGEGDEEAHGRAILEMASKVPQYDREMMIWVMDHVPGAKRGFGR